MLQSPLKTGIMGLEEPGRLLLEATRGLDIFNIVAVADSDANLAQQFAKLWNCASYDDYRQLIMQNQLDCLFVAAPLHSCVEYLRLAIKKKFNILKVPPPGRNYAEAAELVKLASAEKISMAVANPGRFWPGFSALKTYMQENPDLRISFIFAGSEKKNTADILLPGSTLSTSSRQASSPQAKWRSDPLVAGGGVILYDCWEIIDCIVKNFGIPQQVYCPVLSTVEGIAGSPAPDRQQRQYLAEDSAVITMKYSEDLCGNLLAGRTAQTTNADSPNWLTAQSQNTLVRAGSKYFDVTDNLGHCLRREEFEDDFTGSLKKTVENFGLNLINPEANPLAGTAEENLKNMAFIEAAYLSARTGMPEEPQRILKIT
jgi:predicted dehydrogenase